MVTHTGPNAFDTFRRRGTIDAVVLPGLFCPMSYRLAALTIPYARDGLSRRRAYAGIAQAGFTHVGLYDRHDEGPFWPDGTDAAAARAAVRPALDAGLQVDHKSHGGVTSDAGEPERFLKAIELAAESGVPSLVCWGPYEYPADGFPDHPKSGPAWQAEVDGFYAAFEPGVRAAEDAGVLLLPKPHTGVGKHGAALRELHDRFNSPAVGVCYDTGNVHYYEGLDPVEDIEPVAGLCRQLIMKDHVGPRGAPVFRTPGDGDIDHQAVLSKLAAAGFNGTLTNERVDVSGADAIDVELARACRHMLAVAAAAFGESTGA